MKIYDHILMFSGEPAAIAALAPLGYVTRDQFGDHWDSSRVMIDVAIVLAEAVWNHKDPMKPTVQTQRKAMPGYFVVVSLDEPNSALKKLPGSACRIIASAQAAANGLPFIVWSARDLKPGTLSAILRVEPMLSGRQYDFSKVEG